MTDRTKIRFSSLSPEKLNSYDGFKDHRNTNSQAHKSHPNAHSKTKLFQLCLRDTECEFTDANFRCMQLFCFVRASP